MKDLTSIPPTVDTRCDYFAERENTSFTCDLSVTFRHFPATWFPTVDGEPIAAYLNPKPVLGVRRDFHNNRATSLIISNRLSF